MTRSTEEIAASTVCRASERALKQIRWVTARFASTCPQCRALIEVGSRVGQPQSKNAAGGRLFVAAWYCPECAKVAAVRACLGPGRFVGSPSELQALNEAVEDAVEALKG